MKNWLLLKFVLASAAVLAACVTINVYFPAAAAEKAADRIIGDVIGKSENAPPPDKPAPIGRTGSAPSTGYEAVLAAGGAMPMRRGAVLAGRDAAPAGRSSLLAALDRALGVLVPAAQAAAPDLDVSSAAIRQITDSMKSRHAQLARYYDSGAIGYTADGRVDVRDANAIPLAERTPVRTLLADENKDRAALYTEIARANGHPEWAADIRSTFAKRWVANAKPGWYYNDGAGWKRK